MWIGNGGKCKLQLAAVPTLIHDGEIKITDKEEQIASGENKVGKNCDGIYKR